MKTPIVKRSLLTPRGHLTFRSVTTLEVATRQLCITEQHRLQTEERAALSDARFVMRCWTIDEVQQDLDVAGFGSVEYWGGYDHEIPLDASDRIVAIARRKEMMLAP